jgi:putative transposase
MPKLSYSRIWVHLLWGMNDHETGLNEKVRQDLNAYIFIKADKLGMAICAMNVQPDHIHILFQLPPNTTVSKVAKDLKGSTSKWISSLGNGRAHFNWQKGYGAFSVSSSVVDVVRRYICHQTVHLKGMTFQEEYRIWAEKYGATSVDDRPRRVMMKSA